MKTAHSKEAFLNRSRHAGLVLLLIVLSGCSPTAVNPLAVRNVGDAKVLATEYYDDGDYKRDLAEATAPAEAWLGQRSVQVVRPALVLDIDETSLSNWTEIKANDFGFIPAAPCDELPRGPCGWISWERRAEAPAISSTLQLYREARSLHVAVFFITGRHEAERPYTERNLRAAGYDDWQHIYMEPDGVHYRSATDFKASMRAMIEQAHYTIIANVGDQPSDLAGGHAERGFLLPDPFYRVP